MQSVGFDLGYASSRARGVGNGLFTEDDLTTTRRLIMADRFYGTVSIGGLVTEEQFEQFCKLMEPCIEDEVFEDGTAHFVECTQEDFTDLVAWCESNNIPLCITWSPRYEYGGITQYWINGEYKEFDSNADESIIIPLASLQDVPEQMTIKDFIEGLDIPDFPILEIAESAAS